MLLLLFFYQAGVLGLVLSDTKIHDKCTFSSRWFSNNCVTGKSFSSVTQSCLTLHDPMDCSMPGFPVHHQLPELTQTHVHRVGDAIQPSHHLLSSSLPAFNASQHQRLFHFSVSRFFASGGQSIGVLASISVLPMNIWD